MPTLNIKECFDRQVQGKRISAKQAKVALDHAQKFYNVHIQNMSVGQAEVAAVQDALKWMAQDTAARKAALQGQILLQARQTTNVLSHPEGRVFGAMAVLTKDMSGKAQYPNVETRTGVIEEVLMRQVGDTVGAFRSRMAGLSQDVQGSVDFIRALFGQQVNNPIASKLAADFEKLNRYGIDRMNRTFANLQYLDTWRFGQHAVADVMKKRGEAAYIDFLTTTHANGGLHVYNFETQLPIPPGDPKAAAIFKQAWDSQTAVTTPAANTRGGGFESYRQQRVLHFQNADAWLEHNRQFGLGDTAIYDAMISHIRTLASDISVLEILGTRPNSTVAMLRQMAAEGEAAGEKFTSGLVSANAVQRSWEIINGNANRVDSQVFASVMSGVRSTITASSLGSAIIPSVPTDTVTAMFAAKQAGLPAWRIARGLFDSAFDSGRRDFMRRLWVNSQELAGRMNTAARMQDETSRSNAFERGAGMAASFVIRAQGLQAWSENLKRVFMTEFSGFIADQAKFAWNKLDPAFRGWMESKGLGDAEWSTIRQTPMLDWKGAKWFDFGAVPDAALGERMAEIMLEQRRYAVMEPGVQVRQFTSQGARGSFSGELVRSAMLFKSFTLTLMTTHFAKAFRETTWEGRLLYAGYLAALTLAGGVAVQARHLVQGKDPVDMTTKDFWGQAALTGGGLGIYGDFINSAVSPRTGSTAISAMAGPVAGLGDAAMRVAFSPYREFLEGGKTSTAGEAVKFLKKYAPGSNLFYSRLVLDRAVWDTLQAAVDPNAPMAFARMQMKAMKDNGQQFFAPPGQGLSEMRTPDFSAALGR